MYPSSLHSVLCLFPWRVWKADRAPFCRVLPFQPTQVIYWKHSGNYLCILKADLYLSVECQLYIYSSVTVRIVNIAARGQALLKTVYISWQRMMKRWWRRKFSIWRKVWQEKESQGRYTENTYLSRQMKEVLTMLHLFVKRPRHPAAVC